MQIIQLLHGVLDKETVVGCVDLWWPIFFYKFLELIGVDCRSEGVKTQPADKGSLAQIKNILR